MEIGDLVKIKDCKQILSIHKLFIINNNDGMDKFFGKNAMITRVVKDDDYYRYLIDIDNGDYWWVDECFE